MKVFHVMPLDGPVLFTQRLNKFSFFDNFLTFFVLIHLNLLNFALEFFNFLLLDVDGVISIRKHRLL